mmetsp:Transcript_23830/g.94477  ORF Transcript_23830/g.94477 Transcript_23830/m.94477 type:complete len:228 (+) Transcript_23830:562-1245(+)
MCAQQDIPLYSLFYLSPRGRRVRSVAHAAADPALDPALQPREDPEEQHRGDVDVVAPGRRSVTGRRRRRQGALQRGERVDGDGGDVRGKEEAARAPPGPRHEPRGHDAPPHEQRSEFDQSAHKDAARRFGRATSRRVPREVDAVSDVARRDARRRRHEARDRLPCEGCDADGADGESNVLRAALARFPPLPRAVVRDDLPEDRDDLGLLDGASLAFGQLVLDAQLTC